MSFELARAWPRFWSRSLDFMIWLTILGFVAGFVFPDFVNAPIFEGKGSHLLGVVLLPFYLVIDAFVLALCGNTIGRALMGIRVETLGRKRLPVFLALQRNLRIWIFGMGLGFPFVTLFTYYHSYRKVNNDDLTSWDKGLSTRVVNVSHSSLRTWLMALVCVLIQFASGAVVLAQ